MASARNSQADASGASQPKQRRARAGSPSPSPRSPGPDRASGRPRPSSLQAPMMAASSRNTWSASSAFDMSRAASILPAHARLARPAAASATHAPRRRGRRDRARNQGRLSTSDRGRRLVLRRPFSGRAGRPGDRPRRAAGADRRPGDRQRRGARASRSRCAWRRSAASNFPARRRPATCSKPPPASSGGWAGSTRSRAR